MGKREVVGLVALWLLAAAPGQVHGAGAAKPKHDAAAPWSELKPLVLRTPFENLRYPHLDDQGNITFIADDTYSKLSKGLNHGIYRYQADGSLVCLVRGGETTVPGEAATLNKIQGLQVDENGVDFVFNAFDTDKKRGLYHWSKGKLETVARTGDTVLPEDTEAIESVEYGTLHGNRLLYKASSLQYRSALVLHDFATGKDRVLCRDGMDIPGSAGNTFGSIANTNWISADSVVFRASSKADPDDEEGGKSVEGIYGWFGVKDWSAASPELAPGWLRTVVDGNVRMPVAEVPQNTNFTGFGSAPVSGNDTAFEATGDKLSGIFTAKTPGGPVRCIVNNHTEFGGPFQGHFTSFGGYPSLIGPNVVFTASATAGKAETADEEGEEDDGAADAKTSKAAKVYKGLFVYRLDRGELFTLVDNREPLDDREIDWFEIGGHVLVGDHFAVTVHFQDRSSRLYLGTIKPEAFKQLTGEAAAAPKKTDAAP